MGRGEICSVVKCCGHLVVRSTSANSRMYKCINVQMYKLSTALYRAVMQVTTRQHTTINCLLVKQNAYNIWGLLGYYTASCGNYLPTSRDNVLVVSTPLSSYWLSSHHTFRYPAVLSSFCVIGFLSYSES
jgi:uncharacterized membrane-anchored protein